ncbi:MAG: hypothetical protein OCD01_02815 [Fibrobacterales bacterium]
MKRYAIILSLTGAILGLYLLNPTIVDIQESRPKQGDYQYLPNTAYVKTMSMGHKNSVAGLIWIDAMLYFGENILTAKESIWILHLVDLITQLDPQFEAAYLFTGTVFKGNSEGLDLKILKRGTENLSHNWRISLSYALRLIQNNDDYSLAASIMRPFESQKGAPEYIQHIHRTFQAKASTTPIALYIYLSDYQQLTNQVLLKGIEANILSLLNVEDAGIITTVSSMLSAIKSKEIPFVDIHSQLLALTAHPISR